ncbi:queuosine precursor transporter [Candidatus Dependentiae bacterium]|nr:queuosine precursor transporter [Candidatus Dependentiae bacterium]
MAISNGSFNKKWRFLLYYIFAIISYMNEIYFIFHTLIIIFFTLGALFIGKEALIAITCLQCVLANLFVLKQITLFGLDVTCSDVFVVGGILGLNLLQEYYGKQITKKAIWISFFIMIFYLVMSQFQIFYIPNSYDNTSSMFTFMFSFMPRLTLASIFGYFVVQQFDCWLYGFFKKIFLDEKLVFRNACSILCTQFLDTILFSIMGLYGTIESIFNVIFFSYLIKVIVIFLLTPFIGLSKKIMKE